MLIKDVFNGYSQRIRLENSLQLQKAKLVRVPQVKLEIAATLNGIAEQLRNDALLNAQYEKIVLDLPA